MSQFRPIVRYFGGKARLSAWIVSQFPPHRTYVEPYGGGGSILLRKERCYAEVYNDLSEDMVTVFKVLRDHGDELRRRVELTPFARKEFLACYEVTDDPIERARRVIARSHMGFGSNAIFEKNTGFRSNTTRSYKVPAHTWQSLPGAIPGIVERLKGVVIECRPAVQVMRDHDSLTTLHYVDPPYVMGTRNNRNYYEYEMSDAQHREMAETLHKLDGHIVLSGYQCELYGELFRDWVRVDREAKADHALSRIESLWVPNRTWEASQGRLDFNESL